MDHVLWISSFLEDPAESLTLAGSLHLKAMDGSSKHHGSLFCVCVYMAGETLVDVRCVFVFVTCCAMAQPADVCRGDSDDVDDVTSHFGLFVCTVLRDSSTRG